MTTPIFIDTDIGTDVDDALALAMAARDDRFDLRGVSTCNGDAVARARQARGVLDLASRPEVPVAVGRAEPIGAPSPAMPVGLVADGPDGDLPTEAPSAGDLLARVLGAASTEEPVHICVIGAMTNVAIELARRPELFDRVACLHVMAGDLGPEPGTEFNLNGDVDAAARLFALPLPIRLAPYDVTSRLALRAEDVDAISAAGELGQALGRQMQRYLRFVEARRGGPAAVRLHDPLCVFAAVDASVVTVETMRLGIVGDAGSARFVESSQGRDVEVIRSADLDRLRGAVVGAITGDG